MRTLLLTAFLLTTIVVQAQYTPATVPNTKLVDNSYVANPDGIISQSTVDQVNMVLGDLEQKTTAQVAVVLVQSIGDATIEDFAQELFQLWGLGRSNDNGLLILLVKDQRKVRFHTGYGLEGPLPDAVCNQIQRNRMVPAFKADDYDTGIYGAVEEVHKILTDPSYAIEITDTSEEENILSDYAAFVIISLVFFTPAFLIVWAVKSRRFADSKKPHQSEFRQMRLKRNVWLIEFGGIPLLILLLFGFVPGNDAIGLAFGTIYLYYMATILHRLWRERRMIKGFMEKRKYFEVTEYLHKSQWYWLFIAIVFPIPFVAYFPFHFIRKRFYRNHSRSCKLCNQDMIKLSEKEDDQFLTQHQLIEESIRSVDYDVWKCTGCGATEAWTFLNRWSKYKPCPKCKTKAWYLVSDRTLVSPTYSSTGTGETFHQCKACNHSQRKSYSIAMLTTSSSSSSSSGGGYSSSSSSSGGSWGGGSSGGGGSTSSW